MFPSQMFFKDINHGYGAAILKKISLWLLPFYMAVATSSYYERMSRTMRTAVVSYFLKNNNKSLAIGIDSFREKLVVIRSKKNIAFTSNRKSL